MAIALKCSQCKAGLKILNEALAGKKIKCPKCKASILVPAEEAPEAEAPEAEAPEAEELEDEAPPARKKKSAAASVEDDADAPDGEDKPEEEEAPRKKKKRAAAEENGDKASDEKPRSKKKKKQPPKSKKTLIVALAGGGAAVVVAAVLFFVLRGGGGSNTPNLQGKGPNQDGTGKGPDGKGPDGKGPGTGGTGKEPEKKGQMPQRDPAKEEKLAAERESKRQKIAAQERQYMQTLAKVPREGSERGLVAGKKGDRLRDFSIFSPDGKYLVYVTANHEIRAWDLNNGEDTPPLVGHNDEIFKLCFGPNGRTLISTSQDKTIRFWDFPSKKPHLALTKKGSLANFSVSSENKIAYLERTGNEKKCMGFDLEVDKDLFALPADHSVSVVHSPSGDLLAMSGREEVKIYSVRNGHNIRDIPLAKGEFSQSVAFSPDGWTLAIACSADNRKGSLSLWDLEKNQARFRVEVENDALWTTFSPDGKVLACSTHQALYLRDLATGAQVQSGLHGPVAFSPGGEFLSNVSLAGIQIYSAAELLKK